MNSPSKVLDHAVDNIAQLPGIGRRSALRLALHLLHTPKSKGENLAESIKNLVQNIKYCKKCHSISDKEICSVCVNPNRNKSIICVVEDIRDVMAIENTNHFNGVYHVLGGIISPIEGVSPTDLNIDSLINRVEKDNVEEIIFALSATMEGDTTTFYIHKKLKDKNLKISSIARGIGIGEEIEYIDELTLARSIINRVPYSVV
ncbi:MAG: recombination protein RecR [Flavobacteriales bacterium]|nr:recombination protein RecR [Flavobacteriales bacterium]